MHNQYARAAALTAIAQFPASAAPTFDDIGQWATWNARQMRETVHTAAAEAVCGLGERAMRGPQRTRKPGRRPIVATFAAAGIAAYVTARKAGGS